MTRHGALQAALEELTAALEHPSLDDGATWLDLQRSAETPSRPADSAGPADPEAEARRAVLEELRGLRPPTPDEP